MSSKNVVPQTNAYFIAEVRNKNGYCRAEKQEQLLQRSLARMVMAELRNKNGYCTDQKQEWLLQRSETRKVIAEIRNKKGYC